MINIIGNIFGTSGYANHTKSLFNSLSDITDVKLITSLHNDWQRDVNDKELAAIKKEEDNDINLIITNPVYWSTNSYAKRNWAYLVWEGDKIPKSFIDECLNPKIEYIICPSLHTAIALQNSLNTNWQRETLEKKIKIIPHGVDLKKFFPMPKEKKKFRFLANKGFVHMEDRGGIQYLIKAYLEEFDGKDTELYLKVNPAYKVADINKLFKLRDDIIIDTNSYLFDDLVHIYNSADVFVSPTRAESFNIPCIEAQACGLPVITTNFGGQTDFCNDKTGWIIGGKLEYVKEEMYEGIKWLTPNITQLRKAMRKSFESDLTDKKKECLNNSKSYSWDNTANLIKQLI